MSLRGPSHLLRSQFVTLRIPRAACVVALVLLGCSRTGATTITPSPAPPLPAGSVAVVGTELVPLAALQRDLRVMGCITVEPPRQVVARALDELVDEVVLSAHAGPAAPPVEPADVDAALEDLARAALVSKDALLADVRERGIDVAELRRLLARKLLIMRMWQQGPGKDGLVGLRSDAQKRTAMTATYEGWRQDPRRWWVEVRLLSFWTGPDGKNATYVSESLRSIRARASAGEDFCQLVALYTHDDSARAQCGSQGRLPLRTYPREVTAAIAAMDALDVAGPIQIGDHLMLVQLVERPKAPPLEEVWSEVWVETASSVFERELRSWLDGLRKPQRARVELSPSDAAILEGDVERERSRCAAKAPPPGRHLDPPTLQTILRHAFFEVIRGLAGQPATRP